MGQRSTRQVLSEKPWRETKGWGEGVRDDLLQQVLALRPKSSLELPSFNILLAGMIGSGKSSFINSINGLMKGSAYLAAAALAGKMASSLTKKFNIYQISPDLPFRIWDTMGINGDADDEDDIINIMRAVEGHVPDGYEFTLGEVFHPNSPGYITNPLPADIAHCVAIVVNAGTIRHMTKNMEKKLKSLAERLFKEQIPFFVLLTRMDMNCQDVTTIFHDGNVEGLVNTISSMVSGLPKNQIFPIINYCEHVETVTNIDILLLYALRMMLGTCESYVATLEKRFEKPPTTPEKPETTFTPFGQQEEGGEEIVKLEASFTKFGLQGEEGKVAEKGKIPIELGAEGEEEEEQMPEFLKKRNEILRKSKVR